MDTCRNLLKSMKVYVSHFVQEYETRLESYNNVLLGNEKKSGKTADTVSGKVGQGVGGAVGLLLGTAVGSPAAGAKGGATVGKSVAKAIGGKLGEKCHVGKVGKISSLVHKYIESKEDFRKMLVEAAIDVFQSFELQFGRVSTDISREHALVCLARDAVNRSVNFFCNEHTELVEVTSIAESVLLGESKIESWMSLPIPSEKLKTAGYSIIYVHEESKCQWKTASMYGKAGIVIESNSDGSKKYYAKEDPKRSKYEKYGFRRLLSNENWNDTKNIFTICDVSKCIKFTDYEYIINTDDVKQTAVQFLELINIKDSSLSENRMSEIVVQCKKEVVEELQYLKAKLENVDRSIASEIEKHILNLECMDIEQCCVQIKGNLKLISDHQFEILDIAKETAEKVQDIKRIIESHTSISCPTEEKGILFEIRKPVKSFSGRNDDLQAVHKALQENKAHVVISQVASICGLGGIGKSELARKYALEYENYYNSNVIWIDAETEENIKHCFNRLSKDLDLTINIDESNVFKDTFKHFKGQKSLFIYDNVENFSLVQKYMPWNYSSSKDSRPYVLITSRSQDYDVGEEGEISVVYLKEFSIMEGLEFVKTSLNIQDVSLDDFIMNLLKELQCFPLALGQAVSYIKEVDTRLVRRRQGRYNVADYVKELAQRREDFLKFPLSCAKDRYTKTVFDVWEITLRTIEHEESCGKTAMDIFYKIAYFSPDDIDMRAMSACYEDGDEEYWNAVDLLQRYSMIDLQYGHASIHRLVQEVTRSKLRSLETEKKVISEIILTASRVNWMFFDARCKIIGIWKHFMKTTRDTLRCSFPSADMGDFDMVWEMVEKQLDFMLSFLEINLFQSLRESQDNNTHYNSVRNLSGIDENTLQYLINNMIEIINLEVKNWNLPTTYYNVHSELLKSKFDVVMQVVHALKMNKLHNDIHLFKAWEHGIAHEDLVRKFIFLRYGEKEYTLLHILVKWGGKEMVNNYFRILETNYPGELVTIVNSTDKDKDTPFCVAVTTGDLEMVKLLLQKGADVEFTESDHLSRLENAILSSNMQIIAFLLENKYFLPSPKCISYLILLNRSCVLKYLAGKGIDISQNFEG